MLKIVALSYGSQCGAKSRNGILKVLPVQTLLYFHGKSIKLQTGYKCGKKARAFPVEQASHDQASHEQASHTKSRSFSHQ